MNSIRFTRNPWVTWRSHSSYNFRLISRSIPNRSPHFLHFRLKHIGTALSQCSGNLVGQWTMLVHAYDSWFSYFIYMDIQHIGVEASAPCSPSDPYPTGEWGVPSDISIFWFFCLGIDPFRLYQSSPIGGMLHTTYLDFHPNLVTVRNYSPHHFRSCLDASSKIKRNPQSKTHYITRNSFGWKYFYLCAFGPF